MVVTDQQKKDAINAKRRARYKLKKLQKLQLEKDKLKKLPIPKKTISICDAIFIRKLEILKKKGKQPIKKSSVKQQLSKIRNLNKKMNHEFELKDFEFLRDTATVVKFVEKTWKTPNSRNSQYQAISSILIAVKGFKSTYEFYSELSSKNRIKINEIAENNKHTEKEAKNFVRWSKLKKSVDRVEDPRDKAIVAMYTMLAPRRSQSVAMLRILNHQEIGTEKLIYELHNWILLGKDGMPLHFIYHVYKTSHTYGETIVDIPKDLAKIMKKYLDGKNLKSGDILFGNSSGKIYKNFSRVVSSIFDKLFEKKITINSLRHGFISDFLKIKRTISEKKKLAKNMGHSIAMQAFYDRF